LERAARRERSSKLLSFRALRIVKLGPMGECTDPRGRHKRRKQPEADINVDDDKTQG